METNIVKVRTLIDAYKIVNKKIGRWDTFE